MWVALWETGSGLMTPVTVAREDWALGIPGTRGTRKFEGIPGGFGFSVFRAVLVSGFSGLRCLLGIEERAFVKVQRVIYFQ